MKTTILWLFAMLSMSFTWAGSETGNGGNAVVCYDSFDRKNVLSIELFDYWEMDQHFEEKYQLNVFLPGFSVEANILSFLKKVEVFDIKRAEGYRAYALEILNNINQYLVDKDLPDINDDNPYFEPVGLCEKRQFAIQIKNPSPSEKRFLINKQLWNHPKTGNDVRAALILHEVIYREFMGRGINNSDAAREYNFLVASSYIQKTDLTKYLTLLRKFKLEPVGVVSTWVKFGNAKYIFQIEPNEQAGNADKKIMGLMATTISLKNQFGKLDSKAGIVVTIERDVDGQYYLAQHPSSVWAGYNYIYHMFYKGEEYLLNGWGSSWELKFYANGRLREGAILPQSKVMVFDSKYGKVYCSAWKQWSDSRPIPGDIELYSDGSLKSCYSTSETKLSVNGVSFSPHVVGFGDINQAKLNVVSPREKSVWAVQGCKQPMIYSGGSYYERLVVDELGALLLNDTIMANRYGSLRFENIPEVIFEGKRYTSPKTANDDQDNTLNYSFDPLSCELKARISIPAISKTSKGLEFAIKATEHDAIKAIVNDYCRKVGLAGIAGNNQFSTQNRVTATLPHSVYNMEKGQEEELALGSKYQSITFNCVAYGIKSLK